MARLLLELLLVGFHQDYALLARLLRQSLPPAPAEDGGQGPGKVRNSLDPDTYEETPPPPLTGPPPQSQNKIQGASSMDFSGKRQKGADRLGDPAMLVTLVKYGGEPLLGIVPRRVKVRGRVCCR